MTNRELAEKLMEFPDNEVLVASLGDGENVGPDILSGNRGQGNQSPSHFQINRFGISGAVDFGNFGGTCVNSDDVVYLFDCQFGGKRGRE